MHRARPTTQRRFQWSAPSLPTSSGARLKNQTRSEEHTSELQSQSNLVCRLLLEKKKVFLGKETRFYDPIASIHGSERLSRLSTYTTNILNTPLKKSHGTATLCSTIASYCRRSR